MFFKDKKIIWVFLLPSFFIVLLSLLVSTTGCKKVQVNEVQPQEEVKISSDDQLLFGLLEENIISGGPGKDGIPPIESPKYVDIAESDTWLLPNDIVFGIDYNGFIAAYPQRIMVWHEIINEEIDGRLLTLSYCPLTGTAIGYEGDLKDKGETTFGVSGNLINSNLVMYDRLTDSYWPQILGAAINGEMKGYRLSQFPVFWTTWERWKNIYPSSQVLSRDTGFSRDYDADPYGSYLTDSKGYYSSDNLFAPVINEDNRLPLKTVVICMRDNKNNTIAIEKDRLRQDKHIEISLGDTDTSIYYEESLDSYITEVADTGKWVDSFEAMWFAWAAYYPETDLID